MMPEKWSAWTQPRIIRHLRCGCDVRKPRFPVSPTGFGSKLGEPLVHGVLTSVETEVKYAGYLLQQQRQIEQLQGSEGVRSRQSSITRIFLAFPTKFDKNWAV